MITENDKNKLIDKIDYDLKKCMSDLTYCLTEKRQNFIFSEKAHHGKPFIYDKVKSFDILHYRLPVKSLKPPLQISITPKYGEVELYVS